MIVNSQPTSFECSEADTCPEYVTPAIQANRTSKQSALEAIRVPVPSVAIQKQFVKLKHALEQAAEVRMGQQMLTEAVLPSLVQKLMVN